MIDKPPYKVPSMAEVQAIPWNGLNVISTFSGCGGSCLGYRMAGYRVIWANEFVPAAQKSYQANATASCHLDKRDIREVQPEDILGQAGLAIGELDLFDGSPPCASFSTSGKREKGWGKEKQYSDTKQRVDDLFFEYTRILQGLQPKTFIAENVSGLIKGKAKGFFKEILSALKACGYRVGAKVLDAKWLGVPQSRQRVIFQGVRNDLEFEPVFPKPFGYYYSVRDALPKNQLFIEAETSISRFAIGKEWDSLRPGTCSEKYLNLTKPRINSPSPCVTAKGGYPGIASVVHPTEKRKFSIAELKRICAFLDDFILTGSYIQQWERLGRAVPPVMMKAIAETIRDKVFRELRCKTTK